MKNKPFTTWIVNEKNYDLHLTTRQVVRIEENLKINLLKIFMGSGNEFEIPPLKIMLLVIHGAMQKFNHGITLEDVYDIFDDYVAGGNSQVDLLSEVILPLFEVSGFIPRKEKEEATPTLEAVK